MVATEPLIGAWGWAVEHRRPLVGVGHVGLVALAYAGAFLLRFDLDLTVRQLEMFLSTLPLLLFVRMATFYWFHLLEGMWRYVSMRDLVTIGKATTLGSLVFVAAVVLMYGHGFPRSVLVLEWGLCLGLVGGVRAGIRSLREARHRRRLRSGKHAVIVGAGDAGETLLREIERNPMLHYNVVAFVDDDPAKRGSRIHDVAIMGGLDDLRVVCEQVGAAEVLVAVPSATGEARRRIVLACRDAGLPFKTVPPMDDLLRGRARIDQLAEVRPEDVLGRDTVHLGGEPVRRDVEGKRILVTGAAGSIGSELCRQLLAFRPERLYLLDRAESGLYFLDLELASRGTGVGVIPIVGDVTDRFQVEEVMKTCAPDVIYHAAAYKHVPLMEGQPLEGIANNVFGTEVVAHAARRAGVRKFVLISTDKAVDPVGIMGMTKRVAEGVVQAVGGDRTAFAAVRFGNVLGS
ncbi:MAG: polysaccharide biosynthesis protein, partial [Candidatus Rokuibacteriota bacterium]